MFASIKERFQKFYFTVAEELAQLSYDPDRKVGAVIVKNNQILSEGYNGTFAGDDNNCKDLNGHTKPDVIHAECNAIMKCTKKGISTDGASIFITCSPCWDCSKLILLAGIKEVYYIEEYSKGKEAIEYLKNHNIKIFKRK